MAEITLYGILKIIRIKGYATTGCTPWEDFLFFHLVDFLFVTSTWMLSLISIIKVFQKIMCLCVLFVKLSRNCISDREWEGGLCPLIHSCSFFTLEGWKVWLYITITLFTWSYKVRFGQGVIIKERSAIGIGLTE